MKQKSKKSAQDAKQARILAGKLNGPKGAIGRWGEGHGATVTVRAFPHEANRLRANVKEKDRAAFVSEALKTAMNKRKFPD